MENFQGAPPGSNPSFFYYQRRWSKPPDKLLTLFSILLCLMSVSSDVLPMVGETVDPHLASGLNNVLFVAAAAIKFMMFLHRLIPQRVIKLGYAKAHLLRIDFINREKFFLLKSSEELHIILFNESRRLCFSVKNKKRFKFEADIQFTNKLHRKQASVEEFLKLASFILRILIKIDFIL